MAYMTAYEVCEKYKISASTLQRLRKRGLPSKKANPFASGANAKLIYDEEEVERFMKQAYKQD